MNTITRLKIVSIISSALDVFSSVDADNNMYWNDKEYLIILYKNKVIFYQDNSATDDTKKAISFIMECCKWFKVKCVFTEADL